MRGALIALGLGAAVAAAVTAWAAREVPAAIGATASGERARRMRDSAQFRDGTFHNPDGPSRPAIEGSRTALLRELLSPQRRRRRPARPIPLVREPAGTARPDGVRVTWYGHASALVELDGYRVLFDPVWSQRCSPSQQVGPRRLHPVPVALSALPPVDAIVISHDHYDHLDMGTVKGLLRTQSAPFVVPLGVGAHLQRWGVGPDRIVELDWGESTRVAGLDLIATPAHHFSGRTLAGNRTLWGSWVVAGAKRRVFYSGDSGYFGGYADIGERYGPFDVTLIQVGAYSPHWPDIHMTPAEGITAHQDLRGDLFIPVHWCTFTLSFHDWSEPVELAVREAVERGVPVAVPRPGECVDVDDPPKLDHWWRAVA